MRLKRWMGIASLVIALVLCAETGAVMAVELGASGSNQNKYDYDKWNSTASSYFIEDFDGNLMRFEGKDRNNNGNHLVEWYDDSLDMVKALTVDSQLSGFGGFYKGKDYYFVVETEENLEESTKAEVFRIIKYDADFKQLDSLSITGGECFTQKPTAFGMVSMEQVGDELYIYTARQRFVSDDGLNHQSNLLIVVDIDRMNLSNKSDMSLFPSYHVSHSFVQLIKEYNGSVVRVDHGDAYPRSVSMGISNNGRAADIFDIAGAVGENVTGVTVGSLEISGSAALVSGNSVEQDKNFLSHETKNVFVLSVDLNKLNSASSAVKTTWLTNHEEGSGVSTARPLMVKISSNKYLVMWGAKEKDDSGTMKITSQLNVAEINGNGELVSGPHVYEGNLAETAPIVHNGKVMWLTTASSTPQFYLLDHSNLGKADALEVVKPQNGTDQSAGSQGQSGTSGQTGSQGSGGALTPNRALETGEIKLIVNGEQLIFDVAPQLQDGRALVPVRGLFEYLGAEVYMGAPDQVYIKKDGIRVEVRINQRAAFIAKDGRNNYYELDVPATLVNDRTLVPLRFIAEALEAEVNWDGAANIVTITTAE